MKPGTRVYCGNFESVGTVTMKSAIPGCVLVHFDSLPDTPFPVTRRVHYTNLTPLCHCSTCRPTKEIA